MMRSISRTPDLKDGDMRRVMTVTALLLLGGALLLLAGCGKKASGETATELPAVQIGAANVLVLDSTTVESGPRIAGSLVADRVAQVRALLNGTVKQVFVEQGQPVREGQLLVELDATVQRDAVHAAESALKAAEQALGVARRNEERFTRLRDAGAVAEQAWENAHQQALAAQSQYDDARTKLASAEQTLGYTRLVAPFTGVVSERPVNVGDGVQSGNPVVTVVDPSRMRLDGSIPAEQVAGIHIGSRVVFSVGGFSQRSFTGTIDRINPAADPQTRQVRLYVTLPNPGGALVAGLFAEGRVATSQVRGLAVPQKAVDRRGLEPAVLRIRGGVVEKVAVQLGVSDEVTERVQVKGTLVAGDTLLREGTFGVAVGTRVQVTGVPPVAVVGSQER